LRGNPFSICGHAEAQVETVLNWNAQQLGFISWIGCLFATFTGSWFLLGGFVSFSLFLFLSLSVGYLCLRLKPLLMRNNHWINFDSRLVDVEINLLGQELFLCLGHIFSAHV